VLKKPWPLCNTLPQPKTHYPANAINLAVLMLQAKVPAAIMIERALFSPAAQLDCK